MVCDHCGRSNLPGSEFCANPACGAYLGWDATRTVGPGGPAPGRPADRKPAERAELPEQEGYGVRLRLGEQPAEELLAGSEHRVQVSVANTGTLVDEFTLVVDAPVRWIKVEPARVSVYPGREEAATVVLAPPAAPAAPAGPLGYRLVVRSALHPHVAAAAGGSVVIAAVDAVAAELAPLTATGRRGATARVLVRNDGNRPALVALDRADHEPGVSAQVSPAALELGPGRAGEGAVRLVSRRRWFGQPVRHPYRVRVAPRAGEPRVLDGAFVQRALLPGWVPKAALGLVPLLVLGGVLLARNDPAPETPALGATPTPTIGPASPSTSSTPSPTPTTPGGTSSQPGSTTTPPPGAVLTVPSLRDVAFSAAAGRLRDLGLRVRRVDEVSNDAPAGSVLRTEPAAREEVAAGDTVTLFVSAGPTPPFDLFAAASTAQWRSGAGALPYGGDEGDPRGFVVPRRPATLSDGTSAPAALETHPQWTDDGFVEGDFQLPHPIRSGDHFSARLTFLDGGVEGRVRFLVLALDAAGVASLLDSRDVARGDTPAPLDLDLSSATGAPVLRLRVEAAGSAAQDWALWVEPVVKGRP